MAKYVLSFTPSLEDKKELIVAYTQHTNVYNDNDYIVAFSPWSIYSAEIIDDMVRARKVKVKASKIFLKQGTILSHADGTIDKEVNKYGKLTNTAQNSNLERGKFVFSGHIIPDMIEEGLVVLKATVDNEVISYFNAKETNVVSLVNSIREKVTHVANNVGNEWYKSISKTHNVETSAAIHLRNIYNALNDQKDQTVVSPFMFMNTEHTLGSLLYREGYRSDEITYTDTLNDIVIGDTIGSQINSLLLQGTYRAVDIALNSSKLKSKYFTISDSTPYKSQSILYSNEAEMVLEKMAIAFDNPSEQMGLEQGNNVVDVESEVSTLEKVNPVLRTGSDILPTPTKAKTASTKEAKRNSPLEQYGIVNDNTSAILIGLDKYKTDSSAEGESPVTLEKARPLNSVEGSTLVKTEKSKLISPIEGVITNLTERAKSVSSRLTTEPMTLSEAMIRIDKLASINQTDGFISERSNIVQGILEQGKAQFVTYVGGSTIAEIYDSRFTKESQNSGVGELEGVIFKVKFEATLGSDLDNSVQKTILDAVTGDNEYGIAEEGILDVILEFLNESISTETEVDVYLKNVEVGRADEGYEDTELNKLHESNSNIGTKDVELSEEIGYDRSKASKDTFITVLGDAGFNSSFKDVSINTVEAIDSGAATVDTYVGAVERAKQQGSKQVFFEKLEETSSDINSSKDVELHRQDETTTHGNPKEVGLTKIGSFKVDISFTDTLLDGINSTSENETTKDTIVEEVDLAEYLGDYTLDVSVNELDSYENALNLKEVDLHVPNSAKDVSVGKDVNMTEADSSLINSDPRDTRLDYIEDVEYTAKEIIKDTYLHEMVETFFTEFKEVAMETIETIITDAGVKDTSLEEFTELLPNEGIKEVHMEGMEKIRYDKALRDTALETLVKIDSQIGIEDVQHETMIKISYAHDVKDTDLHTTDSADREVEYEAIDNPMEDASSDRSLETDQISELEDGNDDYNIIRTERPIGMEESISNTEIEGEMASEDEATVDRSLLTDRIAEIEDSVRGTEIEAIDSSGHDMGNKFSSLKLTIGNGDEAERELSYVVDISEIENSARDSEFEMTVTGGTQADTTVHLYSEITGQETSDKTTEFEATISNTNESTKKDPAIKLLITNQEAPEIDRSLVTDTINGEEGKREKEIDLGEIPDGIGGEVKPGDPDHPAVDPDPKDKIWMIMGKNYPSWQNWNPKKTR